MTAMDAPPRPDTAEDRALAAACLAGDPAALARLDEMIRLAAARVAGELRRGDGLADEIRAQLRERLLVGDRDGPPRLGSYLGEGPLARWLAVAATRTGLNLLRQRRRETGLDEDRLAQLPSPATDPDLDLLRRQYRGPFESALREAFASIEGARDRNLLRLYYLERLGLEPLAQMYQVHPSTVSRWLAAIREQVFGDTLRLLRERTRASESEVASIVRLLRSDLDLTLSQILAPASS